MLLGPCAQGLVEEHVTGSLRTMIIAASQHDKDHRVIQVTVLRKGVIYSLLTVPSTAARLPRANRQALCIISANDEVWYGDSMKYESA